MKIVEIQSPENRSKPCPVCGAKGLKVAIYSSQGRNKAGTWGVCYKHAAIVSFGVDLPDLYCDLVLAGQFKFRDAVKVFHNPCIGLLLFRALAR